MEKKIDFKKTDQTRKYNYRKDRLKLANELGYTYISECTVKLYEKHKSTQKVADILGLSSGGVQRELSEIGVKLRPRGGKNYKGKKPGRHSWNPLATNTRAQMSRAQ